MRIPPLYKLRDWQILMGGMVIGALLSWAIFLYVYGSLQDKQIKVLIKQQEDIQKLETQNDILIEDKKKINEENKQKLVIQEIKIEISNTAKYNIDALLKEQLVHAVNADLSNLLMQNVDSISHNRELLRKAVENKVYHIDDYKYKFKISTIYFDTTLEIVLEIMKV